MELVERTEAGEIRIIHFWSSGLSSSGPVLEKARIRRSSTIFPAFSYIFRDMPGATPGTLISAQFLWRISGRNLVCRGRQRFTFGSIFPLPADRTFRFVVHHEPFRRFFRRVAECIHSPAQIVSVGTEMMDAHMIRRDRGSCLSPKKPRRHEQREDKKAPTRRKMGKAYGDA